MKKKILLSSALVILICISLIAGATFALFTSNSSVSMVVGSATVNMTASIDQASLKTYSWNSAAQTSTENTPVGSFVNGGGATLGSDGRSLELVTMTPGDKVEFTINTSNSSNVAIKYCLSAQSAVYTDPVTNQTYKNLFPALKITVNGKPMDAESFTTGWQTLTAGQEGIDLKVVDRKSVV